MPQLLEHYLFRLYSRAVKDWLINTCYLFRLSKEENVLVIYDTPGRAFAKYVYPLINGQQFRPTISFHLNGMAYGQNENNLGFVRDNKYNSTTQSWSQSKPALVYKLTYGVTIRTILASDMDILVYQLLTSASFNAKAASKVDGQWMEIHAGDPRDETNLEPGDAQDKIIRFGLDLTIPRAYLPRDYKEDISTIQTVILTYDTPEEITDVDFL